MIAPQMQLKIYEAIIMPAKMYSMDARSKSRIKDIDKFEILQRKIIRQIFVLFQSTPYWGVVAVCDIWSRKGCVNRKK